MTVLPLGDKLMADQFKDKIEKWVKWCPGEFSFNDIDKDFGISTIEQRRDRTIACEKLVEIGVLERVGKRRGLYRPRENELVRQFPSKQKSDPVKLWMPFNLTTGPKRLVDIYSGNIVTIAGEKNSGKTAFLLNVGATNRRDWNVHYFNSEMPDSELALRTSLFDIPKDQWELVNFYDRHNNFSDVIFSGENDLNIIDFLEVSEDFWLVARQIRDIYDKLGKGVCIIALQKKRGAENPRGGEFGKEKTRVHLDLVHCDGEYRNKLIINPAKNWAQDGVNPTGMYVKYKLARGNFFKPMNDKDGNIWFREK